VAVSALAVALLVALVDLRALWDQWRRADPGWLALALGLFFAQTGVRLLRWHLLLRAIGVEVSFRLTASAFMAATFANLFLPAEAGGDVVRAYKLGEAAGARGSTWASVVMDRLAGMLAMFGMAAAAILGLRSPETSAHRLPAVLLTLVCLLLIGLLLSARVGHVVSRMAARASARLATMGEGFFAAIHLYRGAAWAVVSAVGLAAAAQLICYVSYYCVAQALGLGCSLWQFIWLTPVIMLLTMLPSANGIGLREGAFILTFGTVGLSPEQATLLSLNVFGLAVALGLVAGAYVLVDRLAADGLGEASRDATPAGGTACGGAMPTKEA
jgi:uncharacterized protein (TIRG00374 family)